MKKIFLTKLIITFCGFILSIGGFSQNLDNMLIEKTDNSSIVIPEQCTPEDLIIVINSSIQDLKFESNMLPDSEFTVTYYAVSNQYIICHKKLKFKLTVSGNNLQSEDIDIFDVSNAHTYRISANVAKGQLNIITNPKNSTVSFPDFNSLEMSTNNAITMVSGKYKVKITKAQYLDVDTVVVIPRDAEKTYTFDLIPTYARIKLNLNTDDRLPFQKAPVIWIDSTRLDLDAYVKAGMNQRSFFDDVEFLKFYEGNIIPLKEGQYEIKIEAESYNPYKTSVTVQKGKLVDLNVSLEPIYGYLTLVDKQFAEGAAIFLDNQPAGNVPVFKLKARVGNHKVRIEKPGLISSVEEYPVTIYEKQNTDLDVMMVVAKKISFESDPTNAEVLMNGSRIGFTPFTMQMNAGNHQMLVRKNGYAGERFAKLINEKPPAEETVTLKLRSVNPLTLTSEENGLLVRMSGTKGLENVEIDSTTKTPAVLQLPFGEYKVSLLRSNKTVYKSTVTHSPGISTPKMPVYSKSSIQILEGYFTSIDEFEASVGRVHIFPGSGLSTAILNFDYRNSTVKVDSGTYSINYDFNTVAPYLFLLNWDWRIGGSIARQVDINLLGRAKYTPGLKILNVNIPQLDDVTMQNYFYGFEISTRLSYCNICFRFGRQINIGQVNYWEVSDDRYYPETFNINDQRYAGSIGISFGGKVNKSNKMLRLWNKPLIQSIPWISKGKTTAI